MDYLFDDPDAIDFHNREKSFTEDDFFSFVEGKGPVNPGLHRFTERYGPMIPLDGEMYAFSIIAYPQFWASLLLARYIKRVSPDAVIVFGGPFITIKPIDAIVPCGQADYWIKGSGEAPLLMLYHACRKGESENEIRKIPGIAYLRHGTMLQNPQCRLSGEEEMPPDFEGLHAETYRYDHPVAGKDMLFLPYRISKGCPTGCSFCTGRLVDRYSAKSARKVVDELMLLSSKYGTKAFMFTDASVNANGSLLSEISESIAKVLPGMHWYAYARIERCNPQLLEGMRKAGCFSLFWGVESASPPTIRLLGKKFRVETMFETIDAAVGLGIRSTIHLMYNTPHETEGDVRLFIRLIECYSDSDQVVFVPHRFMLQAQSSMVEHPQRYGLRCLKRRQAGLFERDEYVYEEADGTTYEDIRKRNAAHRKMLEPYIEGIEERNRRSTTIREQM